MSNQGLLRTLVDASLYDTGVEVLNDEDVIKKYVEPAVTALFAKHQLHLVLNARFKIVERHHHLGSANRIVRVVRESRISPTNTAGGNFQGVIVCRVSVIYRVPIVNGIARSNRGAPDRVEIDRHKRGVTDLDV